MPEQAENPPSDCELLQQFADRSLEPAFEELVERYLALVYGTAMRRLGNPPLAEEVAQNVFATLARKAGSLKQHPSLAGWLQKTAAFQALRAGEKEQTRRRKMREYESNLEAVGDSSAGAGSPDQEAAGQLDAAILALPDLDRQTILLRFYRQLSFKAIGNILGKNAGACQKQTSRALDKLGQQLRKRGVTISAAAVGTLLTGELARSAPQGVSVSLAAVTQAQGNTIAAGNVLGLAKSWPITAAAILGIAIVSVAGYSLGRASAVKGSDRSQIAQPATSRDSSQPILTAIKKKKDSAAGRRDLVLREIIRFARAELQEAKFNPAAERRALARIGRIPYADIPAALDIIGELPGSYIAQAALTTAILNRWAEVDGQAACEFSLAHQSPPLGGGDPVKRPLRIWALHAPQAAFDWFLAQSAQRPDTIDWDSGFVVRPLFASWVSQDVDAAIAAAKSLKDRNRRSGAIWGLLQHGKFLPVRTGVLDYFNGFNIEPGKENYSLTDAMDFWGAHRPEELAAWIDAQDSSVLHEKVPARLFSAWSSVDSKAAVDWWQKRKAGETTQAERTKKMIGAWSNISDASQWLAAQSPSIDLDQAYAILSEKLLRRDPEGAREWASQITDEVLRKKVIEMLSVPPKKSEFELMMEAIKSEGIEAYKARLEEERRQKLKAQEKP